MATAFLITFRETLEMTLIVGIVLAFLRRAEAEYVFHRSVWMGVFAAIFASTFLGWVFTLFLGGYRGRPEEIVEGILMLVAAMLLTWMIIWMSRQARIRQRIESRVAHCHKREELWGLFTLVFVGVLREGIETVIFLHAAASAGHADLFGAMFGVIVALLIGFLFFAGAHKMQLKWFFRTTSALLILFAAGLVGHGVHELQEAGLLPLLTAEAWNTNHLLDDASAFGSMLKGLFGYNGNPSVLEVFAYGSFLTAMGVYSLLARRTRLLPASS